MSVEGGRDDDWQVVDGGGCVFSLFLPATRQHYDLEGLWTGSDSSSSRMWTHADEDDDEEEAAVVNGARRRRSRSRALQDQKITDHHGDPRDQRTWCSPPVPIDDLALVVRPVPNETYPNDPDLCGHYFFPYQLAEDVAAATGGFEVSDFDVVWRPQSYAANQDLYPHLDYSLLVSDTHVQSRVTKRVPFLEEQPFPPRPPPPPAASRRR